MISYEPFYRTLERQKITESHLIYKQGFSAGILRRMRHGRHITLKTLDTLCLLLDCNVADIMEYRPGLRPAAERPRRTAKTRRKAR